MPIWILVFLLLLTSCQHEILIEAKKESLSPSFDEIKDGAPPQAVPILFRPVTPKYEPMSRYGNPATYKVRGKTYQVLRSAYGYKSRGIASWYGTKFHQRKTSSGEPYNMYAMTAAHKTLPLPTWIRVKNLSNGRTAIVKVNDRGPFHSDRILDLSYAAAHHLGISSRGTAPVEIETIAFPEHKTRKASNYYLQLGAFSSKQRALTLQKRLQKYTKSRISIESYRGQYIVKTGPYRDRKEAQLFQKRFKKEGFSKVFMTIR